MTMTATYPNSAHHSQARPPRPDPLSRWREQLASASADAGALAPFAHDLQERIDERARREFPLYRLWHAPDGRLLGLLKRATGEARRLKRRRSDGSIFGDTPYQPYLDEVNRALSAAGISFRVEPKHALIAAILAEGEPDPAWVRGVCPGCGGPVVANAYYEGGRGCVSVLQCWYALGDNGACRAWNLREVRQ